MSRRHSPAVEAAVVALRDRIASGAYRPGSVLASESKLALELGLSRGTVRRAIDELIDGGELTRRMHARPIVASQHSAAITAEGDVLVWVAQSMTCHATLPFLKGVSVGLAGTRYRMVVREPSRYVGEVVKTEERRFFEEVLHKKEAAGLIVWRDPYADDADIIERLLKSGVPMVFVDSPAPRNLAIDHVGTCNTASAMRCVDHLIELGHQRIACIIDSETPPATVDRASGYWRAMSNAGLRKFGRCIVADQLEPRTGNEKPLSGIYVRHLATSTHYSAIARRVVSEVMAMNPRPTALFVGYDVLAYWVCAALEGFGLRVPDDISVVGFDWFAHWNARLADVLTTAGQDFEGFGWHSANVLIDRIGSGRAGFCPKHVLLDAPLVIRSSTAMPDQLAPGSHLGEA